MAETRCGLAALIGAPNAGKSTLINRLVGQKVAIVSRKVQTTRTRILGIATIDAAQIVYIDTPGIFRPKKTLERAMVGAAWTGATDADVTILLVDASRPATAPELEPVLEELIRRREGGSTAEGRGAQVFLALNKIDQIRRETLPPLAAALNARYPFDATFMIAGLNGDGVADLERAVIAAMPAGPWLYPEDQIVDLPSRLMAAECTREQIFNLLHDELPYETAVETDQWKRRKDGSLAVGQTIHVRRDGQKAILLGKGGQRIKQIGMQARAEMEELFGLRIHLNLFVKVRPDWPEKAEMYALQGLEFPGREDS